MTNNKQGLYFRVESWLSSEISYEIGFMCMSVCLSCFQARAARIVGLNVLGLNRVRRAINVVFNVIDSVTILGDLNFLKSVTTIIGNLAQIAHILGNFCKGVISFF